MPSTNIAVSFIGSGNVACQLAPALKKNGYTIEKIIARNPKTGKSLAKKVGATYTNNFSSIEDKSSIIIIAVNDDAIADVVQKLPSLKKVLVIHTSGATDIDVLNVKVLPNGEDLGGASKFKNIGVLWQIQTIQARSKVDFKKVPLVVEANNPTAKKQVLQLAKSLSNEVHSLTSEQRKVLHLGAVFVNNFPNHLYVLAEQLLKKHKLPFSIYAPLILSTAHNGIENPKLAQTGPAKRNDKKSMANHLSVLDDENMKKIYKLLSESIQSITN
jgi:predicted short-subunit dehydrogenase-like oxidoreductase (DUF2520 family)